MKTLKDLRITHGFTQRELAKLFDVSEGTITSVEKGSENIKDSLIKKYMQAFSIDYHDIFLHNEFEIFEFYKERKKGVLANLAAKTQESA